MSDTPEPSAVAGSPGADASTQGSSDSAGTSVLDDLLSRLSAIDDVPLDDRPALFEQANEVLVAALADLEEV